MPLKDGAVNEILPFAGEALVSSGDILSLEEYSNNEMRKRGHQAGLALRALQNIQARQSSHMAAGLAQFLANRYPFGVKDDGDLDKIEEALEQTILSMLSPVINEQLEIIIANQKKQSAFFIGEFYYFRHPKLREGFEPAKGAIIQRANALYPEAWDYFQTAEGKQLCKTEEEWQAMTKAVYYTAVSTDEKGEEVIQEFSFNGIGGAPFYVQDINAGTLRLPDIRGMYAEASGFDGLSVGGVHLDMIMNIEGSFGQISLTQAIGAFYRSNACTEQVGRGGKANDAISLDISRVVPTGNANKPRAWGANACVYLGKPNITS